MIALREIRTGAVENPLERTPLPSDDPKMVAIEAYVTFERRGVKLDPGKH